ncbi:MAG: hypothetical protein ABEH61_01900 [Haloarculaceae archaeon]
MVGRGTDDVLGAGVDHVLLTATAAGETAGASSQWSFGTMLVWVVVVALVLYALYRRFG